MDSSKIPSYVKKVANILIENGFEAYIVGGCVRDTLLGRTPKDWDIATNALPEKLSELFTKSILIGARFGTVAALVEDEAGETFQVEVTTYRSEAEYIDGRWPAKVEYAKTIEEDLMRRDFTINALAVDMRNFSAFGTSSSQEERNIPLSFEERDKGRVELQFIDLHGGLQDMQDKIIRAVGNPIERFTEDGLRPYRACRFASTLNFEIDDNTFLAIKETLNVAKMVSTERVRDEFTRLLMESSKPSYGIELLRESGLLELFLPELLEGFGVEQNDFHVHDVYWHNLYCVDAAPDNIKLAALLHDIGKPRKKVGPHFYGHDLEGAEMAKNIMKRLRFSNDETERVANLIRWHMFYYPISKVETDEEKLEERNEMMHKGWSDQAVRRFIRNVGGQDAINDLFELRIADATCNPKSAWDPTEIDLLQDRISKVLQEDLALKVTDLDITGNDIMNLGVPFGPKVKEIQNYLLEKVEENPNLNGKEELIDLAKEYLR